MKVGFLSWGAVALLVTGCSAPTVTEPSARQTLDVDLSRQQLLTLGELRRDLQSQGGSLIIATVASSREAPGSASPGGTPIGPGEAGYVPATESDLINVTVLTGPKLTDKAVLHQLLPPSQEYASIPKMEDGKTYMAAVRPFTFGDPSTPTGKYVVAGFEAVWLDMGRGEFSWMGRAGSVAKYPKTVSAKQLTDDITGS